MRLRIIIPKIFGKKFDDSDDNNFYENDAII